MDPLALRVAARFQKKAEGFLITPSGLERPSGTNVSLEEGCAYALGADSRPKFIVLTKVTDDRVKYKLYPFDGKEFVLERWIAADLIERGTKRYLQQYGAVMDPGLRASMNSLLKGGHGRQEDLDDFKPVVITVKPSEKLQGQDLWRAAEEYGNVAGKETKEGVVYEIESDQKRSEQIKNDNRFEVLNVKPRKSRDAN